MFAKDRYTHLACGQLTIVPQGAFEQYCADPEYAAQRMPQSPNYVAGTFCAHCKERFHASNFRWADGSPLADPPKAENAAEALAQDFGQPM